MTRPGRPGPSRPQLTSVYGGSIDVPEGEAPLDCCSPGPRPDRALDSAAFTVSAASSGGIVQTKVGAWSASGSAFTLSFDDTPTNGNTMVGVLFCEEGTGVIDTAGWSQSEIGSANAPTDHVAIWTKVAGVAESPDVHVQVDGFGKSRKLVLYEVAGTVDVSDATSDDSNASPLTGPTLTPSSDPSVLIAAFLARVATYAGAPTFTPQGDLVTDEFQRRNPGRGVAWAGHVTTGASAYTPTLSTTTLQSGSESASVAVIVDATPVSGDWDVPAPRTVDGDDATYHEIEGPDVLRVDLGAAFRIVRARLFIGTEDAGTRTYMIRGANAADFSDAVALGTATFTATGSFTGDDVEFLWSTDESYRYFELSGNDETRRIYSFELYEPSAFAGEDHDHDAIEASIDDLAAALDEHVADSAAAHAGSAITFTPAAGIAATDVQAAIEEDAADLAAHLADSSAAHAASAIAFTPAGTIAATDVQAAIEEVVAEAGSGVTLSDDTPLVESGAGDEGTSGEASRSDHVHPADGGGGGGGVAGPPQGRQTVASNALNTTNPAVTLPAAPLVGNRIILGVNLSGRSSTGVASTNTTWTQVAAVQNGAGSRYEIWVGVCAASPGSVITVSTGSSNFASLVAIEITDALTPTAGSVTSANAVGTARGFMPGRTGDAEGTFVASLLGADNTTTGISLVPGLPATVSYSTSTGTGTVLMLTYAPASGPITGTFFNASSTPFVIHVDIS